jgi:SAM-dependent methyltransferase
VKFEIFKGKSRKESRASIFSKIYAHDLWNGGSGPGSRPESTIPYRQLIQSLLDSVEYTKVVDLGCGDWQFSQYINWSKTDYLGVDVVDSVIASNQEAFASTNIKFLKADLVNYAVPQCDLLLSKDVLQHLSNASVAKILANLLKMDTRVLITNDIVEDLISGNLDTKDGGYRPLDLSLPPFSLNVKQHLEWDSNGFTKRTVELQK